MNAQGENLVVFKACVKRSLSFGYVLKLLTTDPSESILEGQVTNFDDNSFTINDKTIKYCQIISFEVFGAK